jgi:hypothetical protein
MPRYPVDILTNGGFESATPPPVVVIPTHVAITNVPPPAAYEGSYKCALFRSGTGLSQKQGGVRWASLDLTVGYEYTIRIYATPDATASGGPLNGQLEITLESGFVESSAYVHTSNVDNDAWEEIVIGPYVATGAVGALYVECGTVDLGSSDAGLWFVDNVRLMEVDPVGMTNDVRSAIVADAEDITTGNGYSMTVVEVGVEPKPIELVKAPAIFLVPGEGGDSDPATLTNRKGVATQRVVLQLLVRSATPHADVENLLDDVRNVIERSDSNVGALPAVRKITVSEWTEVVTQGEIHNQWGLIEAVVTVEYLYTRGSV